MMFVSGETGEPTSETTTIIEEIVHEQVLELLRRATAMAQRRNSRSISLNDVFFQIRHDRAKTQRLKTFLSWKDVRKSARDEDSKGGEGGADIGDDPLGGGADGAGPAGVGPPDAAVKGRSNKRAKIILPWDIESMFSERAPERDEDDDEEEESNAATIFRLKAADERTKTMSKEEYVHYSECRQASFTYRKAKRFREWAGFGIVTDSKPNDDIVDVLGFLTFEIVQTLTEEALRVKAQLDESARLAGGGGSDDDDSGGKGKSNSNNDETSGTAPGAGSTSEGGPSDDPNKKRKREGPFGVSEESRVPVGPKHIQEAFRRLQSRRMPGRGSYWMGPPRAPRRTELRLF